MAMMLRSSGAKRALRMSTVRAFSATQYSALPPDKINPKIKNMEYAVRGQIVLNAQAHIKALKQGEDRPFPDVVLCNIGNPQSVGQMPLTFPRQVLALCTCPSLLENKSIVDALPADVVARAKRILGGCSGLGAYSESKGIEVVRDSVKAYIEKRDGYPTNVDDLFLTNGASEGVKTLLNMLIRGPKDGVMIPIPQYPLYSASITALGGAQVGYFLDEPNGWALTTEYLDKAAAKAKAEGVTLRTLAVINPGNPTGQVMTEENIKETIAWAAKENLLIMADEVYQTNVYDPNMKFHSFKKVLRSMPEYADKVELVSFHSTSKGIIGECGMRGGYLELVNIHPDTKDQVYKSLSVNLCSNLPGQVMCDLMVNEPQPGDPSYESYKAEFDKIFQSLQRRALKLVKGLNSLEGVKSNPSSGAMYAFPGITFPQKWIDQCKSKGIPADTAYCLDLLDATGICVVPGSGFGQVEGTWHFRTTFLPQEDAMDGVNERLAKFHAGFMAKYK
jgi:alanine transaminase